MESKNIILHGLLKEVGYPILASRCLGEKNENLIESYFRLVAMKATKDRNFQVIRKMILMELI